jgi:hypothetical protein
MLRLRKGDDLLVMRVMEDGGDGGDVGERILRRHKEAEAELTMRKVTQRFQRHWEVRGGRRCEPWSRRRGG